MQVVGLKHIINNKGPKTQKPLKWLKQSIPHAELLLAQALGYQPGVKSILFYIKCSMHLR